MFSAPFINVLIYLLTPFNFLFKQWKKLLSLVYKSDDKHKTSDKKNSVQGKSNKNDGVVYIPYNITDSEVVGKTIDERYIRENNKVKFIYAKDGETVYELANMLGIYDYQIIKYNNLGNRKVLRDNEIIYIEPKKNKATCRYKYHTIQKGETLSYVSRLYAVKLKSIYKMNDMNENTILHIGDNIRLR